MRLLAYNYYRPSVKIWGVFVHKALKERDIKIIIMRTNSGKQNISKLRDLHFAIWLAIHYKFHVKGTKGTSVMT